MGRKGLGLIDMKTPVQAPFTASTIQVCIGKMIFPFLSASSYWSHLGSHFPVVGICCGSVIISVSKQYVGITTRDLRIVAWFKDTPREVGGHRENRDLTFRTASDGPALRSRNMTGPGLITVSFIV